MRKIFKLLGLALVLAAVLALALAGTALAAKGPMGPAPNSGDCISDGSGFEIPMGPAGTGLGSGPRGPAPNSGDGIPDGSGF